ncbi:hypothetical protein P170DRAFT_456251 [Aspergillus steynii IBT 23096]|uniref:Azaphilone pigments biosynthesis cluster protein L N-terminal domain-containing protein n=1 Tax=Aspergillus steynii IBT 23096 TaxID=1392250 RepID=A0A2I2G9W2_9EURO|nr:uncharacterized protein P170DRAFT_456251 [Aspergillus steynii IBT 23096]PLB49664.1 hypothetical protein P170DRAFT_456251 [Aspergillus steynii IBT 23096]
MAEPISLASGLLALATFAFQSSIKLYETVKSFHSHPKRVRDLLEELEALSGVLGPLTETISSITDVDLTALDLPLLRCGHACGEFEQEIQKCSMRSEGSRTSFRDWAKLRYMGDDIDGFRRLLAGYKLTINIALTDVNLRKSSITAESLRDYEDLIVTAKADLEAHLETIDGKLELIFQKTVAGSDSDASELRLIEEERLSTEKCLQICTQLSNHISQIQSTHESDDSAPGPFDFDTLPERVTKESLQDCKKRLTLTAAKLERHMKDLMDKLLIKSRLNMTSEEEFADLTRLREEWETARQCMDICSRADDHLKENISNIDNYATGDAVQFMVSTNGTIIHGKNRGVGWRSRQVGGHLSDVSLQQLSRDFTSINLGSTLRPSSQDNSPNSPNNETPSETTSEFKERYGRGFRLSPKTSQHIPINVTAGVEERSNSPKE